jgi:hypothetical protein
VQNLRTWTTQRRGVLTAAERCSVICSGSMTGPTSRRAAGARGVWLGGLAMVLLLAQAPTSFAQTTSRAVPMADNDPNYKYTDDTFRLYDSGERPAALAAPASTPQMCATAGHPLACSCREDAAQHGSAQAACPSDCA